MTVAPVAVANNTSLVTWGPPMLSLLRFVAGLCLLEHGMQKLLGFPPGGTQPAMYTLIWFAGVLELVGGALVALGLFTRVAAFIVSGEMAVAYWMVHAQKSFFPVVNGGDAAILFCFVFLYVAVVGGGSISLDRAFFRRD